MTTLFESSSSPEFRMAQVFIEVYGCEKLTEDFLRTVFDAMVPKQGLLFKGDFCKLFQSSLVLSGADSDRVINSMPDYGMSFSELKAAVFQALEMQITQALYKAPMVHQSGSMIVLSTWGLPQEFEKFLYPLEKELGVEGRTKYVIFEEKSGKSKLWRIHAVGREDSTAARLQFPKSWRGAKGTQLARLNGGVRDSVSVSRDGCLGTSSSKDGAIALAASSLASNQNLDAAIATQGVKWQSCEI